MKKRIFSILLVVVMTMALVACGSQPTNVSAPEATETVSEAVESADTENSEVVSETEQAAEAPVDEATSETESAESASEPETSTEVLLDSEAVETTEVVPEPESTVPEFTVADLNATKYAIQVVNVRSGPSTDFDKIGSLSTNQEITVNGVCDQTGWFRFDLNGTVAFVSNRYVSDEKVEKPAASEAPSNGGNSTAGTGSTASNWADGYPKNQWIDMGEYVFYIANSQAEANQVSCDYFSNHLTGDDGHLYHTDLNARYPDRRLYTMAYSTEKGNVPIAIISTYINEPWYNPTFIWE